jgi:hypothetical protein
MTGKSEIELYSARIKQLGEKSTQLLLFISFSFVAVVTLKANPALSETQQHALSVAMRWWVWALLPILIGIVPLKDLNWENERWYSRIRWFKFVVLCVAIILILIGAVYFGIGIWPAGHATQLDKGAFTESSVIPVPRGITGLEVGMTPQQIGQLLTIKEAQDPVVMLLKKYGKPDQAVAVSRQNEAIQKRFFTVSPGVGNLPDAVTSADVYVAHNIVYQIGLHFDEAIVKKIGWEGVTYPYVAKYGKPSEDTGSAYAWKDGHTRLEIVSSGSVINVFFTDEALEIEVKKEERKNPS